jgi:transcriptional regulator with XRE-family HTH domain
MNNEKRIGLRIRQERINAGISKCELARKSGLTYATINNVEKGTCITLTTLEKICDVLGLKITLKQHTETIQKQ